MNSSISHQILSCSPLSFYSSAISPYTVYRLHYKNFNPKLGQIWTNPNVGLKM